MNQKELFIRKFQKSKKKNNTAKYYKKKLTIKSQHVKTPKRKKYHTKKVSSEIPLTHSIVNPKYSTVFSKKTLSSRNIRRAKKTRVFYILGHSSACYMDELEKIKQNTESPDFRLDISKYTNLRVVNMQGYGVLNAYVLFFYFLKLLNTNQKICESLKNINSIDSSQKFRKSVDSSLKSVIPKDVYKFYQRVYDSSLTTFNVYPKPSTKEAHQNPIHVSYTFYDNEINNMGVFEITDMLDSRKKKKKQYGTPLDIFEILNSNKINMILTNQKNHNIHKMQYASTSVLDYNRMFFENIEATLRIPNNESDIEIKQALELPFVAIPDASIDNYIKNMKCKYDNKTCSGNLICTGNTRKNKRILCEYHHNVYVDSDKNSYIEFIKDMDTTSLRNLAYDLYFEEELNVNYNTFQNMTLNFNEEILKNMLNKLKKNDYVFGRVGNPTFSDIKKIDKTVIEITLEEILDIIYKKSDIKDDEEVLVIDFGCKSLKSEEYNINHSLSYPKIRREKTIRIDDRLLNNKLYEYGNYDYILRKLYKEIENT